MIKYLGKILLNIYGHWEKAFTARPTIANTIKQRGDSSVSYLTWSSFLAKIVEIFYLQVLPLAIHHRTKYPIVQAPMSDITDSPEFAKIVADSGALPVIALEKKTYDQVEKLLSETRDLLEEKSWGVGLLGFLKDTFQKQIKALEKNKPPFAFILGGTPYQVYHLQKIGIETYLYVSTPRSLRKFIEQGIRNFILEGRECAGHIGPFSSFSLWEQMLPIFFENIGKGESFHILFAGGIHDFSSAQFISAMAAPLVDRGAKVGVSLGTAYLFTKEIVLSEALSGIFQQEVLNCKETVELSYSNNYVLRCAMTEFVEKFKAEKGRLLEQKTSLTTIKKILQKFTQGRLLIAAKGVEPNSKGGFIKTSTERQKSKGLFPVGEVAILRNEVISVKELHDEICERKIKAKGKKSKEKGSLRDCCYWHGIHLTPSGNFFRILEKHFISKECHSRDSRNKVGLGYFL